MFFGDFHGKSRKNYVNSRNTHTKITKKSRIISWNHVILRENHQKPKGHHFFNFHVKSRFFNINFIKFLNFSTFLKNFFFLKSRDFYVKNNFFKNYYVKITLFHVKITWFHVKISENSTHEFFFKFSLLNEFFGILALGN